MMQINALQKPTASNSSRPLLSKKKVNLPQLINSQERMRNNTTN